MKKKVFKKFQILFVSIGMFLFPLVMFAQAAATAPPPPQTMAVKVALMVGWLFQILYIFPLGILLGVFLKLMIALTGFNIFVNSNAVVLGWSMIRDVANLFFVIILLVIAFSTILQFESYNYKRLLPKLLIMALLINFSKMFAGIIIDFSNVVMNFFATPFQGAGYTFFLTGLQLDKLLKLNTIGTANQVSASSELIPIAAGLIIATLVLSVTFFVVLAFVIILVVRIVALWILIVLSPLAFLCGVIPATQKYWSQWWQELSKYAIVGPVMAFFLWLAFSLMNGDTDVSENLGQLSNIGDFTNIGSTFGSDLSFISKYIVIIAFLIVGLKVSQQLGVAGQGLVGSILGSAKKNMLRYGKLAALASGVGGVALTPGAFTAGVGAVGKGWGTATTAAKAFSPALASGMGVIGSAAGTATSFFGGTLPGKLIAGGWLAKKFAGKRGGLLGGAVGKAGGAAGWAGKWLVGAPLIAGGVALAAKATKESTKDYIGGRTLEWRTDRWRGAANRFGGVPILGRAFRKRRGAVQETRDKINEDARSEAKRNARNPIDLQNDYEIRSRSRNVKDVAWSRSVESLFGGYLSHYRDEQRNFVPVTPDWIAAHIPEDDSVLTAQMPTEAMLVNWARLEEARAGGGGSREVNDQADRLLRHLISSGRLSRFGGGQYRYNQATGQFLDSQDLQPTGPNGAMVPQPVNSDVIQRQVSTYIAANATRFETSNHIQSQGGHIRPHFHRGGTAGGALEADPRTASFIDLVQEKSVGMDHLSSDELRKHILKNTTNDDLERKGLERQEFETRMRQATPAQLRQQSRVKQDVEDETYHLEKEKFERQFLATDKMEEEVELLPRQGVVTGKWGATGAISLGEDTHGMALSFEELGRFLPADQAKILMENKGEETMNVPEPLKQAYAQAIAKYIALQRVELEQAKTRPEKEKALEAMGLGLDIDKLNDEQLEKRRKTGLEKLDTASGRLKDSKFVAQNPMNLVNADATSDINRRDQLRHESGHVTVDAMVKNGANLEEEFGRLDPKTREILEKQSTQKGMDGMKKEKRAEWLKEVFADFHGGASKELRENERTLDSQWKFGEAEKEQYDQTTNEEEKKNTEYGQFAHRDEMQDRINRWREGIRKNRQELETKKDQTTDLTKRKAIDRELEGLDKEDETLNERERKLKNNRFTRHHEAVTERDTARDEMHKAETEKGRDSKEYKSARKRYDDANDTVESFSVRPGSREDSLRRNKVKEGVVPAEAPQTNLSSEEMREVLGGGLPQLGAAAGGALVANIVTNMKQEFKLPEVQNRITQQFANRATNNLIGSANDFANPNSPFYMMRLLRGLKEGMQKLTQNAEYEKMYDKKERGKIEDTFRNINSLQKTAKKLEERHNLSTDTPNVDGAASDFQVQTLMDAVNDFFRGGGKEE